MDKLNLFIVEDNPILAEALVFQLEKLGYGIAGMAKTADEALIKFSVIQPDLALLDIDLGPGMNGIDLARKIQSEYPFPFVFLSGIKDAKLLKQAEELEPVAFLKKPVTGRKLNQGIQLAMSNLSEEIPATPTQEIPQEPVKWVPRPDHFFIRWKGKYQKIYNEEVDYIEAAETYSIVHCKGEKYTIGIWMKEVEDRLRGTDLLRIHRSYMVNIKRVDSIEENSLVIGDAVIPVGKTYRPKIREVFNFL